VHEDRSLFAAAEATIATIVRLAPGLANADAAWDAFAEWLGPTAGDTVRALRRAGHSLFTTQLHQLYAFGRERLGPAHAPRLCREAGRTFAETVFGENLHPLLTVARARPGEHQAALLEMIRAYLTRYAGSTYEMAAEPGATALSLTLRYRDVEGTRVRDRAQGLDPDAAFRDSAEFITGAMEAFARRAIADLPLDDVAVTVRPDAATIRLPVRRDAEFAYARLLDAFATTVSELTARHHAAAEDERREQDLILGSPVMRATWDRVRKAARSDEIVLLRGPSGTGKSFIARKIHGLSRRAAGPFVEVALTSDVGSDNMVQSDLFGHEKGAFTGAVAPKVGLFALADGGTLFLDEIGDASPEVQAKLLRVIESGTFRRLGGLQDHRVDVRIVAATNRDLEARVAEGGFRADLYYRINVIGIPLPPLCERRDDVPALAEHLLARLARGAAALRLAPGVATALQRLDWPGNVRELDHALRYAAAMCEHGTITQDDLPDPVRRALEGAAPPATPAPAGGDSAAAAPGAGAIQSDALRAAIRRARPLPDPTHVAPHENPAHVEHAKRAWLAALIDECGGDLAEIGRFWDRGSEKTLRKLIREYGLADRLAVARSRAADRNG
jgi:DNA-binding NtrC family response regulator